MGVASLLGLKPEVPVLEETPPSRIDEDVSGAAQAERTRFRRAGSRTKTIKTSTTGVSTPSQNIGTKILLGN